MSNFLGGLFIKQDLLGAAMQASVVRNDVINHNIANADTPGFKKHSVRFETYFKTALADYRARREVNFAELEPSIQIEHTNYEYRLDGNNVDIENEMVDLYQNSVRYDMLTNSLMDDYKKINLVLSSVK